MNKHSTNNENSKVLGAVTVLIASFIALGL